MSTVESTEAGPDISARTLSNLWMHFTNMGAYSESNPVPVIVRAEGNHVWDSNGKRYLDGFSGLASVNVGYGRSEITRKGAEAASDLAYFPTWGFSHPLATELAERVAGFTPDGLDHVFFTSTGSESVDAAIKLVRQYHRARGKEGKVKVLSRQFAYHGTTFGAVSLSHIPRMQVPFEPLLPGTAELPATRLYRLPEGWSPADYAAAVERRIVEEGADTVAALLMEPVQNSGGSLPPPEGYFQAVREICDRHDVLLVIDEVMTGWGRLGKIFGCERYGIEPDLMTMAKGLTSSYAPIGAVVGSEKIFQTFNDGASAFAHGCTFGGHPLSCAVALANLDVLEGEALADNVAEQESAFVEMLESLYDLPIVGDVRGAGFMYAVELVRDRETKQPFSPEQIVSELKGKLNADLVQRGLICRVDDRGDAVIQLAPALTAGPEVFDEMHAALRPALEAACSRAGL